MNISNPRTQFLNLNLLFFSFGLAFWLIAGLSLCYSTLKWGELADQQVMTTKMLEEAIAKWKDEHEFSLRLFDQRDELREKVKKLEAELENERKKR